MEDNPFLALLTGVKPPQALKTSDQIAQQNNVLVEKAPIPPQEKENPFNDMVEKIFRLTLRRPTEKKTNLFYMQDVAESLQQETFDESSLGQAVLDYCVSMKDSFVDYLFQCYERTVSQAEQSSQISLIKKTIFSNLYLAFIQPELFPDQKLCEDFTRTFNLPHEDLLKRYVSDFADFCQSEEISDMKEVFCHLFNYLKSTLAAQHLMIGSRDAQNMLVVMSSVPLIAKAIVSVSLLNENEPHIGRHCEQTLLGSLLVPSCIPRLPGSAFDFFERPSQSPVGVHQTVESNIWSALERNLSVVHKIFYNLLKVSPEVNNLTRTWIGQVLTLNKARGQTWSQHNFGMMNNDCASDGFMMNFGAALLQLCQPICSMNDPKAIDRLSKIDPTFCASKYDPQSGVHIMNLDKETCLTSKEDRPSPKSLPFSFSTEIFFMTHRALELGPKALHQQMVQLSQSLSRLQRAYQDATQNGQAPVAQEIQERMDVMMSSYLCCKAVLLVPEWMNWQYEFVLATARWLCATALNVHPSATLDPVESDEATSDLLSCIPEFCLSNLMDFVLFSSRFSPVTLDNGKLDDLLTLVVVFMGSPHRLKNPHLRAALAEMLDCLMPPDRGQSSLPSPRTALFVKHPRAKQLVATLLHVFASIEMTGQGVRFEEKFNYRRPMYAAMKFLWSLKLHKNQFKALAVDAESKMEAATPPRFLQFVNLLINDAIYLLDEGLSYMAQLKEQQQQRANGTWPDVPAGRQRQEREATYQHITMLARFHNMMGRETIHTLSMMTSDIKGIFVHSTIVDRVAAMLNYFLLHLVGPKKRDFVVKDKQDYEFDPKDLVVNICQIYCHLGTDDNFCAAVSQDGRSYNPELFTLAEDVLSRIGQGGLIGELTAVAQKVAQHATVQASDEDLVNLAPEDFLDPIMSHIMANPVILPSSKVTVDRSTIARHLLSDQSDPFNRSPLTMEQVVPNDELKARIDQWMAEIKQKKATENASSN